MLPPHQSRGLQERDHGIPSHSAASIARPILSIRILLTDTVEHAPQTGTRTETTSAPPFLLGPMAHRASLLLIRASSLGKAQRTPESLSRQTKLQYVPQDHLRCGCKVSGLVGRLFPFSPTRGRYPYVKPDHVDKKLRRAPLGLPTCTLPVGHLQRVSAFLAFRYPECLQSPRTSRLDRKPPFPSRLVCLTHT